MTENLMIVVDCFFFFFRFFNFNYVDDQDFASTVLWLEDQKIRHYRIEDRDPLRNIDDFVEWNKSFEKYKIDIGAPKFDTRTEDLEWILSYAVRLEYMDRANDYKHITAATVAEAKKPADPTMASKNPFDAMDMSCEAFEQGVRRLGHILNIAYHPDHLKVKTLTHTKRQFLFPLCRTMSVTSRFFFLQ